MNIILGLKEDGRVRPSTRPEFRPTRLEGRMRTRFVNGTDAADIGPKAR